jgi:hypothetical protein
MKHNFFEELEIRRSNVERIDLEMRNRNLDHYRNFWLQMIILSSAIVIGVLPILDSSNSIIKSIILAKLGLLIIVVLCVLVVFYFQSVLSREKSLLFDQVEFHRHTFLSQSRLLQETLKTGRDEKEVESIFENSKRESFIMEQEILAKHLIDGKFVKSRLFIDKHFGNFISYGFSLGILLVILSFII